MISYGLSPGGIERASSSLANYFVSVGYKVSFISLYKTERFYTLDKSVDFFEPDFIKHKSRLLYAFKIFFYLRRNLFNLKPDVMLSYGEWINPLVILSTRFTNIPLYISDRENPTLKFGFFQFTAKKLLYKYSDGIIAQTNFAANLIKERTKARNVIVIPNPVNSIQCIPHKKEKLILTMGRLHKGKGIDYLIEAFSEIKNIEWKLGIVGDGPERERLELIAEKFSVSERVIFYGFKRDVAEILSKGQIFVFPSFSEGFPNALIEAMSVPLTCVSSDCVAGPSDIIIHGENGFLFPPGDKKALASIIEWLINNPQAMSKIEKNAYKINEDLDFDRIAKRIIKFIKI